MLQVLMLNRDWQLSVFDDQLLQMTVRRLSWHAVGGPLDCEIEAAGEETGLMLLFDRLRCPVYIIDPYSDFIWWGYIHAVEGQFASMSVGYSLDSMANSIKVAYSYVAPGSATVGERRTTTAATNTRSIGIYGTKELTLSLDGATDAQATNYRDTELALRALPRPEQPSFGHGESVARILCRGWYHTLDWRYYAQPLTASVETTQQIVDIEAAVGDFLTGVRILNASVINSSQYRDGDSTAKEEIDKLLAGGTSSLTPLYARVNLERKLEVYAEPTSSETGDLAITPDGGFTTSYGDALPKYRDITGQWFRPWHAWPGLSWTNYVMPLGPFFIEECEYDAASDRQRVRVRGQVSPWDILRVRR